MYWNIRGKISKIQYFDLFCGKSEQYELPSFMFVNCKWKVRVWIWYLHECVIWNLYWFIKAGLLDKTAEVFAVCLRSFDKAYCAVFYWFFNDLRKIVRIFLEIDYVIDFVNNLILFVFYWKWSFWCCNYRKIKLPIVLNYSMTKTDIAWIVRKYPR